MARRSQAGARFDGAAPRGTASPAHRLFVAALTLVVVLGLVSLGGCARHGGPAPVLEPYGPAPEGHYRIRYGDTLGELAERLGIRLETLAAWNDLKPPYPIQAGRLLRVAPPPRPPEPRHTSPPAAIALSPPAAAHQPTAVRRGSAAPAQPGSEPAEKAEPARTPRIAWQWPLSGRLLQTFKASDRTRQGIRIAARPGQLVAAAAAGTVAFSGGGLKAYGNLIIIEHADRFLSAYGFNRRLLVAEGEKVQRGQSIAEAGRPSADERAQLHFEIRRNGVAVDPLTILPQSP